MGARARPSFFLVVMNEGLYLTSDAMVSTAEVERTLKNLHVLSALSHNDKLLTNGETFGIYSPTALRGMFRLAAGESRVSNIDRIRQAVTSGINFAIRYAEDANEIMKSSSTGNMVLKINTNIVLHQRTCEALKATTIGLNNLTQTYRDDPAFASQVTLLVLQIEDSLRVMPRLDGPTPSPPPPKPPQPFPLPPSSDRRFWEDGIRYVPLDAAADHQWGGRPMHHATSSSSASLHACTGGEGGEDEEEEGEDVGLDEEEEEPGTEEEEEALRTPRRDL